MSIQKANIQKAISRPTAVETRVAVKSRLLYIDNLRMMLITSVILFHIAITYGADGSWYYHEGGETSTAMFVIMMFLAAIGSAFALGLFFMLAGYFTPRSYDRKKFWGFLLDRMKRLLIPLAFYEIIIFPVIRYLVRVNDGFQGSLWNHLAEHFGKLQTIADGPVWFLLSLMIFSFFYALLRVIAQTEKNEPTSVPDNLTITIFAFALGIVTFIVRLWLPVGIFYEPLHQEFAHYPQYIAMFAMGTFAYRHDWITNFPDTQAQFWRWVALLCVLTLPAIVIAAGALTGQLDERGAGGWNWISFSYSVWEGFTCLAFSISVLAWFRKRLNRQSWLAGKMADAAFTAYVIHPAIIVPLALFLSGITMKLGLKFFLVAPLAISLTYVISYYFRRLPLVRNVF